MTSECDQKRHFQIPTDGTKVAVYDFWGRSVVLFSPSPESMHVACESTYEPSIKPFSARRRNYGGVYENTWGREC